MRASHYQGKWKAEGDFLEDKTYRITQNKYYKAHQLRRSPWILPQSLDNSNFLHLIYLKSKMQFLTIFISAILFRR